MTNFEYLTQKENIRELAKNLINIRTEEEKLSIMKEFGYK